MELDKKDTRILRILDQEGRIPYSMLSRKVQVSKEVARYRVQRLLKDKVILGFHPVLDFSVLGMEMYYLLLNFHHFSGQQTEDIESFGQKEHISRIRYFLENWDFGFFFHSRDEAGFLSAYDALVKRYGQLIAEKNFSLVKSIHFLDHAYLFPAAERKIITVSFLKPQARKLDAVDRQIIGALFDDARMNIADLAVKLKKPVSTVNYHFRQLEEKVIRGYRLELNYSLFGLQRFILRLWLHDLSQKNKVVSYLQQQRHVTLILDLAGDVDIEVETHMTDVYQLKDFLKQLKRTHPAIKEVEIIHLVKESTPNPLFS